MSPPICPYCSQESRKVRGSFLYRGRQNLADKIFYLCDACNAYIGCHPGSDKPLGSLAKAELRKLRNMAHGVFDPLWMYKHFQTRKKAYAWLAEQLGIPVDDCHMACFDEEQCRRVIALCEEKLRSPFIVT
jgi:hypothetical protein